MTRLRFWVAWIPTTLLILRVTLWLVKAIAGAETVSEGLRLIGLHQPAEWLESGVDALVDLFMYLLAMR